MPRTVALSDLAKSIRDQGFTVDDEQLRRVTNMVAPDLEEQEIRFGDDLGGAHLFGPPKPTQRPAARPGLPATAVSTEKAKEFAPELTQPEPAPPKPFGDDQQLGMRLMAGAGQRLLQSVNTVLAEASNLVAPLAEQETAAKLRELGVDTALLGQDDQELAAKVTGKAVGEMKRLRGRAFFKAPQLPENLVGALEERGILHEARFAERIAQNVGDIMTFFLPITAASKVLGIARLGGIQRMIGEGALLATGGVLELRHQARGAGTDASPGDYGKAVASGVAAVPLGMLGGNAVVKAIEKLAKRPLGKAVADVVRGGALGVGFEGGGAALGAMPGGFTKDEAKDIAERAIAGGIAFPLAGAFSTLFDGPTRSRTRLGIEEQVEITAEYLDAVGFGERGGRPAAKTVEAVTRRVREAQAAAFAENSQVPFSGKPQRLGAADLERIFGVSPEAARDIAKRRPTEERWAEILEMKQNEAELLIAEQKAPEVKMELLYRRGFMTPPEARAWEARRAGFSQAEIETIVARLPSRAEVDAAIKNDEFRFEVEGLRFVTEAESRLLGRPLQQREPSLPIGEMGQGPLPRRRGLPAPQEPTGPTIRMGIQPKQLGFEPPAVRRATIKGGKIVQPPMEKPSRILVTPPPPPGGGVAPISLGGRQARIQTSRLMRPAVFTPVGEPHKTQGAADKALAKAKAENSDRMLRVSQKGDRFIVERQLAAAEPVPRLADILPTPRAPDEPGTPPPTVPEKGPKPPEARSGPQIRKAVKGKAPAVETQPAKPVEAAAAPEAGPRTIAAIDREVKSMLASFAGTLSERSIQRQRGGGKRKGERTKGERTKGEQLREMRDQQTELRRLQVERSQMQETQRALAAGEEPRTVSEEDVFGSRARGRQRPRINPLSAKKIEENVVGRIEREKRWREESERMTKVTEARENERLSKDEGQFEDALSFFKARGEEFASGRVAGKRLEEPKATPLRDIIRESPASPPIAEAVRTFPGKASEIMDRAIEQIGERAMGPAFKLPEGYKRARKERTPERIRKTLEAHLEGDTAALIEAEKRLRERPKLHPDDWELPVWAALVPAAGIVGLQLAGKEEEAGVLGLAAAPFFGFKRGRRVQGYVDRWVGKILERKASEPPQFSLETREALSRLRKSRMGNREIEEGIRVLDDTWAVEENGLVLRRQLKREEIGRFSDVKEARAARDAFEEKSPEMRTRIIRRGGRLIVEARPKKLVAPEPSAIGEKSGAVLATNMADRTFLNRFFVTLGPEMARRGPAGEALTASAMNAIQNTRNVLGKAMFDMRTLGNRLVHDIDPHKELSNKENRNLVAVMEDGATPMNDDIRIRAEMQKMIYRGERSAGLEQTVAGDANVLRAASDAQMRYVAERAIEVGLPFVPRLNAVSGSYGPVMFREEVHPPRWPRRINPKRYEREFRRSEALRERIFENAQAKEIKVPNPDNAKGADGKTSHLITREEVWMHLNDQMERGHRASPWHFNVEEAGTVRRSPYLEHQRLLDVDVGIEWDPARIYRRYVRSAVQRLELAQEFGPEMERARWLIRSAGEQGYDERRLQDMFDSATGQHPRMSREQQLRLLNEISGATTITALGLSNISQLTSWARTPEHTRFVDFLTGWSGMVEAEINRSQTIPRNERLRLGKEELARFAAEAGVAVEAEFALALSELRGTTPRMAGAFLRRTGMIKLDRMGRTLATSQSRSYARWLLREWKSANSTGNAKEITATRKRLEELYADDRPVTPASLASAVLKGKVAPAKGFALDIALKLNKTPAEMRYLEGFAAARVVARAHGRTEPIDLPEMASHPWGGHLFKLMTFSIRMTDESVRQAMQFRQLPREQQLMRLAAAAGAMGTSYLLQRARLAVMGRDPKDQEWYEDFTDVLAYYGFMSAYIDFARARLGGEFGPRNQRWQERALRSSLGPTYETAIEALYDGGIQSLKQWSGDPLYLFLLGQTPQPWRSSIFGTQTPIGEKIEELEESVKDMAREEVSPSARGPRIKRRGR